MGFTYSDPATDQKDAVRFLIGDTDPGDALLSDEEITYVLTDEPDTYQAAALAAEHIAAKFAREINQSGDGLSWQGEQLFRHYQELAESLGRLAKKKTGRRALPYVGGIYKADRRKDDDNSSMIPSYFRSHQHDNPNTSSGFDDPLKS